MIKASRIKRIERKEMQMFSVVLGRHAKMIGGTVSWTEVRSAETSCMDSAPACRFSTTTRSSLRCPVLDKLIKEGGSLMH
jgi:hypothetical protein